MNTLTTIRLPAASGLIVLAAVVLLQGQLIQPASAEVTFLNKWGSLGSGNGQFDEQEGLTVASTGEVFVADAGNGRIQRFDVAGNYETQWETSARPHG